MSTQKSTSPSACSVGLPISLTAIAARSSRRSAWSSATRLIFAARSATVSEASAARGEGQRGEPRAGLPGPADSGIELVVGDLGVLLELLAGGGVNDCVHAQRDPLLIYSIALCWCSSWLSIPDCPAKCPPGLALAAVPPAPSVPAAPSPPCDPRPSSSSGGTYSIPTPSATAAWVTFPPATLIPRRSPGSSRAASAIP